MSKDQGCYIDSFDDLLDHVIRLPLKDQKDLAEDILRRLEEKGYDVIYHGCGELQAIKTESL